MTTSNERSDLLNLPRDVATAPGDVAAQRRLKAAQQVGTETYLRFLATFEPLSSDDLRRKRGPRGNAPFELIP